MNLPHKETARRAVELAKEPERILAPQDRQIVGDVIGRVLDEDLEGRVQVYAGAIERTHVHLLLGPMPFDIDEVVGRIKSRTSSAVIKSGSEPGRTRTWTNGFWKVFVFDCMAIPDIQNYIENHNVRRGLARVAYPWIIPFN